MLEAFNKVTQDYINNDCESKDHDTQLLCLLFCFGLDTTTMATNSVELQITTVYFNNN